MNLLKAKSLAADVVRSFGEEAGLELMINDDQTIEGELGWLFFYNTTDYIRYGRAGDALAGNGPVVVFKSGRVDEVPSFVSIEEACKLISAKYPRKLGSE
jgi:hypothetical protein